MRATAAPKPEPPPVTTKTFPGISMIVRSRFEQVLIFDPSYSPPLPRLIHGTRF
jgi:hypothetical protein